MRRQTILFAVITSFIAACASAPRPTTSASSCGVVTERSQLDGCVGKTVTLRGKISRSQIAGVMIQAPPELADEPAHAVGTLVEAEGHFELRNGEVMARAHGTRVH